MRKTNTIIISSVLISFLMITCGGCGGSGNRGGSQEERGSVNPDTVRTVSGYGRISSLTDILEIAPEVGGTIQEVRAEEGDTFSSGDTLFIIGHDAMLAGIERLRSQIHGSRVAIRATARTIETARSSLESRETYLNRVRRSEEKGTVSKQQLDDAALSVEQEKGRLEELMLKKEQQEHELQSVIQLLRQEEIRLSKHFYCPADSGIVLSLEMEENMPVKALQPVGQFRVLGPYAIEGEIDELYAVRLSRDLPVKAVPYGRNDTIARGRVVKVSPRLSEKSIFSDNDGGFMDRRVRSFEARIDSAMEELLIGQRVNIFIELEP